MPVTPDQEWTYWDSQLTALRRGQLATVQQAATGWKSLFGALLGIFTTVAFAGGLTNISMLASPWAGLVKIATLVAVVAAVVATYWASKASQSLSPHLTGVLDANSLMVRTENQAATSLRLLQRAKVVGCCAVAIVLAGSATVLIVGPTQTSNTPTVIAVVNGHAVCGTLTTHMKSLAVGGSSLSSGVSNIIVVPSCP